MSTITALPCLPSLKCMLFGGYVPPEIPGRQHLMTFDEPTALEIAARNRAPRERPPLKRLAIMVLLEESDWLTAQEIAERTESSIHYTHKTLRNLTKTGLVQIQQRGSIKQDKAFKLIDKNQPEH